MPAYQDNDPRHPHNRMRLMWHAWKEAGMLGRQIKMDVARAMVKIATGVTVKQAVYGYLEDLSDLGIVDWQKGEGITPRRDGLSILDA